VYSRLIFQKSEETAKDFGKVAGGCREKREGMYCRDVELLDYHAVGRTRRLHIESGFIPGVEYGSAVAIAAENRIGGEK
jgi:hypothetical protein